MVVRIMTYQPITLDDRRGMDSQKATEIRRLLGEVEANEQSLRARQEELEMQLMAAPAATWFEAGEKARYLLGLFAATPVAQDPRRKMLIEDVLEDFTRLSGASSAEPAKDGWAPNERKHQRDPESPARDRRAFGREY